MFNTAPVSGGFDFVLCAVNIHNQGDWAGKYAFLVKDTYDGNAVFYNTFFRGNPEYLISTESGNLVLQQGDFSSGGSRGIMTVKAGGNVTMDNLAYSNPLDLEVPTGGVFRSRHSHLNGGYGNTDVDGVVDNDLNTYAGSVIAADSNQVPPRDRGITMDESNVAPVIVNTLAGGGNSRSTLDYVSQFKAYHLTSGDSVLFNVMDPDFVNGAAGDVDIKLMYLDDTDGTFNVYYDSDSGEKLIRTYTMSSTDTVYWTSKPIGVNDARFNSSTSDIHIEVIGSADPVFAYLSVESDNFLGLPASADPSYSTWAASFLPVSDIGNGTSDYDEDGINNLAEYALAGDPLDDASWGEQPTIGYAGGLIPYVHPQRSDDASLTYIVETRTNLVFGTWTHAEVVTSGTNVLGGVMDEITNSIPVNTDGAFYRLRINNGSLEE